MKNYIRYYRLIIVEIIGQSRMYNYTDVKLLLLHM